MTSRLVIEPEAEADFRDGIGWYRERSPQVAAAFRVAVAEVLEA